MDRRKAQIEFYHRLAPDYDRLADPEGVRRSALYDDLFPDGVRYRRGLDLGCGTGNWTRALVEVCDEVTATDSSPDMIAAARRKLGSAAIEYRVVDLLSFPDLGMYDVIFSTFWISHVPLDLHDAFWAWIARSLSLGGDIVFQDSITSGPGGGGDCRTLPSGETFQIVKNAYDFQRLADLLDTHGLAASIRMKTDSVYVIRAKRAGRDVSKW